MTTKTFNLDTRAHRSRVLDGWMAGRPGAAQRAGVTVQNAVQTNLTADELVAIIGAASATASGVSVTTETAMRVATVYACVSIVSGAIATLPLGVFERDGSSRKKVDHEYWWMFNEQACDDWTSFDAWQYLISAKMFYGDGFAEILRPSPLSSRAIGWSPLHPSRTEPFTDKDGTLYYRLHGAHGQTRVLDAADVIHLPSLGFDGLRSPSPITYAAREAIGTSIAAEAYQGKFFNGGATFDYALHTPHTLNDTQYGQLKESLMSRAAGGRVPLILTGDLQPAKLSVDSKDAEILATRMFAVEELCRIMGVPPHMIGHTDKSTSFGTGIEQQSMAFVRYTLMRHLVPLAQEINRKLWPSRARYFVEHITEALERGDLKSRYEAHRIALGRAGEPGWKTVNEIRRIENDPPIDGGDTLNNGNSGDPNAQPPA